MKTKILAALFATTFATAACSKEEPKNPPTLGGNKTVAKAPEASKVIKTKEDIRAFQKANGLTADGVAGPKTQALMKQKGFKYEPVAPAKSSKKDHELNLKTPPGKAIK